MARGDHICVRRFIYWHHGIDCGDGMVIHYAGSPLQRKHAKIEHAPLEKFTKGAKVRLVRYTPAPPPDEVMERAERRLGENRYKLIFNNCEHFARWCMTGVPGSKQVETAFKTVLVTATLMVVGGIMTIAAAKVRKDA